MASAMPDRYGRSNQKVLTGRRSVVGAQLPGLAAPSRMVKFTSMDNDDVFDRARSNRVLAADMFAGLTDEQWQTPSLCAGWTVRDVAGHMIMPMEITFGRFLLRLLSERGSFDRTADKTSRALAQRPTEQIVAILRGKADSRFTPPGIGALGPMTDSCVHLRDAARPLGLLTSPPLQDWRLALDFLVSPTARRGFVPRGRLDGLTLRTSDQEWTAGAGPLVKGPSEAVALALAGRIVALEDLTGDGVAVLRERLVSG
ncbi:MAG: maleylpyruvate isomerase family mycothiol-dependent enzyme [Pseudonocardiales bacterium]|nr:MAG: maleylpyruvate isomerase family mycothiol-dependent enzyme [Pseudonocardiales bacterium]